MVLQRNIYSMIWLGFYTYSKEYENTASNKKNMLVLLN